MPSPNPDHSSAASGLLNPGQARALALAARHVNASTRTTMGESQLLDAIRARGAPPGLEPHLLAFIDETDRATLCDLVLSSVATYGQLAALADDLLPASHPTRRWLDERRDL